MSDRLSMKVPLLEQGATAMPDPVERASICLELTRNQEYERTKDAIEAIHASANDRGKQMITYLDYAKQWVKDMKEIAGA